MVYAISFWYCGTVEYHDIGVVIINFIYCTAQHYAVLSFYSVSVVKIYVYVATE